MASGHVNRLSTLKLMVFLPFFRSTHRLQPRPGRLRKPAGAVWPPRALAHGRAL